MSDLLNFLSRCCTHPVTQLHHKNKWRSNRGTKIEKQATTIAMVTFFVTSIITAAFAVTNKVGRDFSCIHIHGHCLQSPSHGLNDGHHCSRSNVDDYGHARCHMLILFVLKQFCVGLILAMILLRLCSM